MSWLGKLFSREEEIDEEENSEVSGIHQKAVDHVDSQIDDLKRFREEVLFDFRKQRQHSNTRPLKIVAMSKTAVNDKE